MAYPRYQLSRAYKRVFDSSPATSTFTSTTPAQIDAALDLAIAAQVGDGIEVAVGCIWAAAAVTYHGCIDVLSQTPTTYFSSGTATPLTYGIPQWASSSSTTGSAAAGAAGGPFIYTVVSNDLSAAGLISLRPMAFLSAAGSRSLTAAAGFFFSAKNIGPVDPN
jgi:hypothetical protein